MQTEQSTRPSSQKQSALPLMQATQSSRPPSQYMQSSFPLLQYKQSVFPEPPQTVQARAVGSIDVNLKTSINTTTAITTIPMAAAILLNEVAFELLSQPILSTL